MKLRVQLQCKNLHQYLRELSPEILDRLYNHPATCLAVYRYDSYNTYCTYGYDVDMGIRLARIVASHFILCLILYRELPSLAKNFVMRMLFLDQPLPQAAVALWVKKESQR